MNIKNKLRIIKRRVTNIKNKVSIKIWYILYIFPTLLKTYGRINKKVHFCTITSIFDYCNQKDNVIKIFDPSTERYVRCESNNYLEFENEKNMISVPTFKVYLSKIENAKIIGNTDFIIVDSLYMTDRMKWDPSGIYCFNPPCVKVMEGTNVIVKPKHIIKQDIDKGVFLLGRWTENYYHLSIDIISRLQYIDEFDEYADYPLLLDEYVFKDSRSVELVKKLNVRNHPIIKIQTGCMYNINTLIYPSIHSWSFLNYNNRNITFMGATHELALKYLRNSLITPEMSNLTKEKIYISRGNNKRLINEFEVADFFKSHGFRIVNTDTMTLKEEIECFNSAEILIGVIGAAFTNLIYCNEQVKIYQICPIEHQLTGYSPLSDPLNLNLKYLTAEICNRGKTVNTSTFYLPISKCEQLIQSLKI